MNLNVKICVPCGHPKAKFIESLATMIDHTHRCKFDGEIKIDTLIGQGALIADLRMKILADAMKDSPTHILWIDDDMGFPEDSLVRLLNHNKPIVGVNYPRRRIPAGPVARKLDDSGWLYTTEESSGLEQALFTGMGLVLVNAGVIDALEAAEKLPCFDTYYDKSNPDWGPRGRLTGEDYHFFKVCREIGVDLWIDHDLSKQVVHMGDYPYNYKLAQMSSEIVKEDE